MPERPLLDPAAFDALVQGPSPALWGAKAIAQVAGVSASTVRKAWVRNPSVPVRKRGGQIFAFRDELEAWLAGTWAPSAASCRSLPLLPTMPGGRASGIQSG